MSEDGTSDLPPMPTVAAADPTLPGTLELGAFSISLNVADLDVSATFYRALGFEEVGGDREHNYLILKNGETTLGLFCQMFESNILTFNPGLTNRMETLETFTDVRRVEAALDAAGIEIVNRSEGESGPTSISLVDPDGNPILIDQFF